MSAIEPKPTDYRMRIQTRLDELVPSENTAPERLHRSMRHTLLADGKLVRPLLTIMTAQHLGGDPRTALDPACAVPEGFDQWLSRLLHRDPGQRFDRAADATWALLELGDPDITEPRGLRESTDEVDPVTLTALAFTTLRTGEDHDISTTSPTNTDQPEVTAPVLPASPAGMPPLPATW